MSETVKDQVRKRDEYRCTECGMTHQQHVEKHGTTLHVHRLVPGSIYTLEGCITLCFTCHASKPRSPRGKARNGLVLLPKPLYNQIAALAKKHHRPISWECRRAIEEHLECCRQQSESKPNRSKYRHNRDYRAVRVPLPVYELIEEIARRADRPTSWEIRRALEEYIAKHDDPEEEE